MVAHSDVVSWWVAVHGQEPPENDWIRWYRELVQRGLDGATTVLAPSRWMLSQIERYYGQQARRHASSITAAARSGSIRMARRKI